MKTGSLFVLSIVLITFMLNPSFAQNVEFSQTKLDNQTIVNIVVQQVDTNSHSGGDVMITSATLMAFVGFSSVFTPTFLVKNYTKSQKHNFTGLIIAVIIFVVIHFIVIYHAFLNQLDGITYLVCLIVSGILIGVLGFVILRMYQSEFSLAMTKEKSGNITQRVMDRINKKNTSSPI
ncbi:MAG: hypothetical protein K5793_05460 [Nitrosarchaeum sp.]|nr:hypothetical protein [Nitrosarchaeum sp.]